MANHIVNDSSCFVWFLLLFSSTPWEHYLGKFQEGLRGIAQNKFHPTALGTKPLGKSYQGPVNIHRATTPQHLSKKYCGPKPHHFAHGLHLRVRLWFRAHERAHEMTHERCMRFFGARVVRVLCPPLVFLMRNCFFLMRLVLGGETKGFMQGFPFLMRQTFPHVNEHPRQSVVFRQNNNLIYLIEKCGNTCSEHAPSAAEAMEIDSVRYHDPTNSIPIHKAIREQKKSGAQLPNTKTLGSSCCSALENEQITSADVYKQEPKCGGRYPH